VITIEDIDVGAVYPPYQLDDFQRCPYYWDVKKRWLPRGGNKNLLVGGILGAAVAYGLEIYYTPGFPKEDPVAATEAYAAGRWVEQTELSKEGLVTLARRGVKRGMQTDLGLKQIVAVEKQVGRMKPDLVGRSQDGSLVVIDHKVKKSLDDQYKEKTLADFDKSNQFFAYAWAIGQEYGEAVTVVYAHLIVLSPRVYTELHPVPIDQAHLAIWLESAVEDWKDMASGENRRRFSACNGRYGVCEYDHGCHVLHGDESLYGALYEKRGW